MTKCQRKIALLQWQSVHGLTPTRDGLSEYSKVADERVERRLQISAEGSLLSQGDRIRESELPKTVKTAMNEFIAAGARFDGADHVLTTEREEFHIELDLGDDRDLHLFLDDRGVLLRQHEVGDF